ncbi:MAG: prepilin peptidase [Pseudoflavonifractor sp.]|nr:prepilin peptidase [Pseudoflavonifractor sp.]
MWIDLLAAAILAVIAWQDRATRTIPDALILLLIVCGAANAVWSGHPLAGLTGLAVCGLPPLIVSLVLKHGFIGGGDVKLCAALGWLLGPVNGILVILLALIGLSGYGLLRGRTAVPFAPFVFPAYLILLML